MTKKVGRRQKRKELAPRGLEEKKARDREKLFLILTEQMEPIGRRVGI